ncbi:hypothetical protein [Sphingopyxis sp.]|uniref:hypothetical protein n=1 Tax=Sphingopyxis sp. TaxID=1908224 RepID=UPI002D79B7F6|nr:hypothetical protein [Sphingopyxis sp.]HET6526994.1 hypothetical protein [Sphingopyxis sp.]
MRNCLAICMALGMAAPASAQQALGANFNEHYEDIDYRDLDKADAHWVRLFLTMPELESTAAADHGAVKTILETSRRGYKTILSLKFPRNRRDFPAPGSAEMARETAWLDAVLPQVMGKIDILVIGNEPYIESRRADRDLDLNAYYEAMAKRAIAFRKTRCGANCQTALYMGALNRLDLAENRTPSAERWMEFVRSTPEIAGVDIHAHLPEMEGTRKFVDYIIPRMRPDQKFLALEFSIVRWWEQHMKAAVPASYAAAYDLSADTRNWQVIRTALESPFPKAQWDAFLASSPWFESRKHYLRHQMKIFRDTGRLAVATYGFKQGSSMGRNFGPKTTPWLLNSVVAARTVRPNPDGSAAFNYAWIDDFRALQEPEPAPPPSWPGKASP